MTTSPECFEQVWAAIRHAEDAAARMVAWYFALVGAILAFTVAQFAGPSGLSAYIATTPARGEVSPSTYADWMALSVLGLFLVTCSVSLARFLHRQRRVRALHLARLRTLEEDHPRDADDLPVPGSANPRHASSGPDPVAPLHVGVGLSAALLTAATWYPLSHVFGPLPSGSTVWGTVLPVLVLAGCLLPAPGLPPGRRHATRRD